MDRGQWFTCESELWQCSKRIQTVHLWVAILLTVVCDYQEGEDVDDDDNNDNEPQSVAMNK